MAAMNGGRVYAIWTSAGAWTAGKSVELAKSGAYPALTSLADGSVLAAWEENGSIMTRPLAKNLTADQTARSGDHSQR